MKRYEQSYERKTLRQADYAAQLARDIRDALKRSGDTRYSASQLAKYYSIDDLRDALSAVRRGEEIEFA